MNALVGCTGFVGSNLYTPERFGAAYHSTDIDRAFGTRPDLLVYAGVRAEKYLANSNPAADLENILQAERNIEKIAPKKLVLISTVDVLRQPAGTDETFPAEPEGLHPYGANRLRLEQWVRENYPDALILRLPGLFGKNLKKNFIYDYIHIIPAMLKKEIFTELAVRDPRLLKTYTRLDNGFWKAAVPEAEQAQVKGIFEALGFSALNFTDSRSRFQFYPLRRLWDDMQTALENGLQLLHLATEPVSAGELYCFLSGKEFINELAGEPADYDFRTVHARCFGAEGPYLMSREEIMNEIREFVNT